MTCLPKTNTSGTFWLCRSHALRQKSSTIYKGINILQTFTPDFTSTRLLKSWQAYIEAAKHLVFHCLVFEQFMFNFGFTLIRSCSFAVTALFGPMTKIPGYCRLHIVPPSLLWLFPTSRCKTRLILLSLQLDYKMRDR